MTADIINSNIKQNITSVNIESPLIWIDMEMSGLDPETSVILEIATIITDNAMNIIAEGPNIVISQPESVLQKMDDWNKQHHGASRLTERVRNSFVTLKEAEEKTLNFVMQYTQKRKAPLCGNTISQDRRFLIKYMPRLEEWLHYRNIDVSTVKELAARWFTKQFKPPIKKGSHKALVDIKESIAELVYYKKTFFVSFPEN